MLRTIRRTALIAALFVPAVVHAQDAALPAAKDLVARHVAAIGGRDAVARYSTMRSTGTFSMPAAGLSGDMVVVQGRDGRAMLKITVPGMGEMLSGYDGTVGWAMNPMQGPRVLEGKELAQLKEDTGMLMSLLRESASLASMETVEKSTLGGVDCYKVKLTYASGRVAYDCYGIENGLMAGQILVQESPMGTVELTNVMTDWKDFGGVKVATTLRQQAMGQEQVMTITGVEFDNAADAQLFELPAAVKALAAPKP